MKKPNESQSGVSADAPAVPVAGPLEGRTVLVTGGAHRVGGAISRHLGALGARVLVAYHSSSEAADALVEGLPAGGRALQADLRQADAPDRLLAACADAGDLPDAVVHSAASFLRRRALDTTAEEWDRVHALNTRAFFLIARAFARLHGVDSHGRRSGSGVAAGGGGTGEEASGGGGGAAEERDRPDEAAGGTVTGPGEGRGGGGGGDGGGGGAPDLSLVAISDAGALELWTDYAVHCLSKAALLPLVQVLARSLGPAVRVNAVLPGPVLPPPGVSPVEMQGMEERTLLKRLGDPDEVARAVAFLLTSRFATGTLLEMTGGSHLWRGRLDRDPAC